MKNNLSGIFVFLILLIFFSSCRISQRNYIPDEAIHVRNPFEAWAFSGIFRDDEKKSVIAYNCIVTHLFDKTIDKEAISAFLTITNPLEMKSVSEVTQNSINADSILDSLALKFELVNENNLWKISGENGNYKIFANMTNHPGSMIRLKTVNKSGCFLMPDSLSEFYDGAKSFILPLIRTTGKIKLCGNSYKIIGNSNYWRVWNASDFINVNQRIGQIIIHTDSTGGVVVITLKLSKEGIITKYCGYRISSETNSISILENISVKCNEYWKGEASKKKYPLFLNVYIPESDTEIILSSEFNNQEMSLLKSVMWIGFVKAKIKENGKDKFEDALIFLN
jgi:hypothetical protein